MTEPKKGRAKDVAKKRPDAFDKIVQLRKRDGKSPDALEVNEDPTKTKEEQFADITLSSIIRHSLVAKSFGNSMFGDKDGATSPDINRCVDVVTESCDEVRAGNLNSVTDMLAAQMVSLDTLFTLCVSRAGANMGQHPQAVDRYFGIALKAQAACRTTAETLARIKRGGKQTVKVVHVHEGGQAVVADTVNHGTTGGSPGEEARSDGQPHGKGAFRAALPSPDPTRNGVPLPGYEGTETV